MDMKLEVVVVPVSEVDRAKDFYKALGWREDADFVAGADFRVVQLTPPGSPCSVIFGTGVTSAARRTVSTNRRSATQTPDWPDWYAQYMVHEQAGHPGPARPGAST